MNVSKFKPLPNLLVVKPEKDDRKTASGIQYTENEDDFITYAEVVSDQNDMYQVGAYVVAHLVSLNSFRDGGDSYAILDVKDVLGTYERTAR